MDRSAIVTNARLAGQVARYHTWPVLRQQSNAEHTWQVIRIWWQIWGPPSGPALTHLLWHDAGELVTGDLPFPVKAENPAVKAPLDRLEARAVREMGGPDSADVGPYDKMRAKVCDLLEMCEYGLHELALGNAYAQPIVVDTDAAISELLLQVNAKDHDRIAAYLRKLPGWEEWHASD